MHTGGKNILLGSIQLLLTCGSIYFLYTMSSSQASDNSSIYMIFVCLAALLGISGYRIFLDAATTNPSQKLTEILVEGGTELDDIQKTIIRLKTYSNSDNMSVVMALTGLLEQLNRKLREKTEDCLETDKEFSDAQKQFNELKQKFDLLQQQPHQRSEFLSLMGDEITSPMQSLNAMLKLLNNTALDQEASHLLKIATHSAYSLTENITNILEFNKLDAGLLELETQPFDLHEAIRQVLETQESIALSKALLLEKHLSADVPVSLNGNERAMRKVLNNLISNAIRFTDNGSISLNVDRIYQSDEAFVRFKVTDTGIGVPEEAVSTLFDSLNKDTHLKNSSFTGRLRLIVSKGLCALMGGEIGLESTEGQGSIFWFTIRI